MSSIQFKSYVRQYKVKNSQNIQKILPLLTNEAVSIRSAGNSSRVIDSVDNNGEGTGIRGAVLKSEDLSSGGIELATGGLSE